ncbi:hypothetical protein POTOM_017894 [Populus tomentosa]|uniref:26S proteasome non-ATPase regulatory subunit 1/RPN2 N-terminal domain-containing protein n=1 Tax=Populus tomentosa TaxID=118781 RepID=A0A8X7ZXW8_POPTO|nr:hypothetical protein POTOM_017894 [Populus tomentosa]
MAKVMNSVSGLLKMLKDDNSVIKQQALRNLNNFVDVFWPESPTVSPLRKGIAALTVYTAVMVVSLKLYYHTGECDDSLSYALGAGSLLYISEDSDQFALKLVVFRHIVNVHQELPHPDLLSICQYLMLLDEPEGVASELEKLLRSKNKDRALVAFQIAFDLVENEDKTFLLYVRDLFSMCQPSDSTQNDHVTDPREGMYAERLTKIRRILSDLLIPKTIKQAIEKSGSVCHNATLYANAILHAGTAVDTFVRENLLQLQQGESQISPYVFESPSGVSSIACTKGGALRAMDLHYANHGEEIKQCICDSLRGTNVKVVQHGACLGLGLAALGTAGENIYDDIKNVLHADSAVSGEAAGISMGLLMVGTASEMFVCARQTQHEKLARELALGIALTVYRRERKQTLIERLTRDEDPILRYGGMYALALAYRGTENNDAILQLLYFAALDVNDDVR